MSISGGGFEYLVGASDACMVQQRTTYDRDVVLADKQVLWPEEYMVQQHTIETQCWQIYKFSDHEVLRALSKVENDVNVPHNAP